MPYDLPEDDEQDEQDPVQTIARYLNPDKDEDEGWGGMFRRVANGPRIKPQMMAASGEPPAPAATKPSSVPFVGPTDPDAAHSLAQFAEATGSQPQTHLSQVGPAPTPSQMPPEYSQAQDDLRSKSAVTPKYDPVTGKTLDRYHEGAGGRIGRAFVDAGRGFLRGGIPGAASSTLEGAFGNPNAPGYYGKGAVNNQYSKDERARQQQVGADQQKIGSFESEQKQRQDQFKDQRELYQDTLKKAYEEDTGDQKQAVTEERTRHDQETEGIRRELAEARDPEAQERAKVRARTAIADDLKLQGEQRNRYVLYGDKSAMDDYRGQQLNLAEQRLGLMQSHLDLLRDKEQRTANKQKDYTSIRVNAEKTKNSELDRLERDFARDFANANKDKSKQDALTAALDANKKRVQKAYEAELAQIPAGEQKPPQSALGQLRNKKTGGPPAAPPSSATSSTISKAQIRKLADKNGMSYADAEKQFKGKNFTITE